MEEDPGARSGKVADFLDLIMQRNKAIEHCADQCESMAQAPAGVPRSPYGRKAHGCMPVVKLLSMLILVTALCDFAAAQTVPTPRPRPAEQAATPVEPAPPSACRLRLTGDLAL